jgi:predicted transcriptional regulator
VSADVPEVLVAREAYKQAEKDALALRARARAKLGYAVVAANQRGNSLEHIARELGVATEQVRRYRQAYRDWQHDHPGEQP